MIDGGEEGRETFYLSEPTHTCSNSLHFRKCTKVGGWSKSQRQDESKPASGESENILERGAGQGQRGEGTLCWPAAASSGSTRGKL